MDREEREEYKVGEGRGAASFMLKYVTTLLPSSAKINQIKISVWFNLIFYFHQIMLTPDAHLCSHGVKRNRELLFVLFHEVFNDLGSSYQSTQTKMGKPRPQRKIIASYTNICIPTSGM